MRSSACPQTGLWWISLAAKRADAPPSGKPYTRQLGELGTAVLAAMPGIGPIDELLDGWLRGVTNDAAGTAD